MPPWLDAGLPRDHRVRAWKTRPPVRRASEDSPVTVLLEGEVADGDGGLPADMLEQLRAPGYLNGEAGR